MIAVAAILGGLTVRTADFHCNAPDGPIAPRIQSASFDLAGRRVNASDPRLGSTTPAIVNQTCHLGLSGDVLLSMSVDAGWRLMLLGKAGECREKWDGAGQSHRSAYDDLLRVIAVSEQVSSGGIRVVERLTYGGLDQQNRNGFGRLVRHDDPAGTLLLFDYGVLWEPVSQARRFLMTLDDPDWPEDMSARDAWLEDGNAITGRQPGATGELLQVMDAGGNTQRFGHDVARHLCKVSLQTSDGEIHAILTQASYTALDQIEQETAGSGVVTQAQYCLGMGDFFTYSPRERAKGLCKA